MFKMKWEILASRVSFVVKKITTMKLEVGVSIVIFLFVGILCTITVNIPNTTSPESISYYWKWLFPSTSPEDSPTTASDESHYHEKESSTTYIKGVEATTHFKNHLECFSNSGKWVYDSKPKHLPWNYVGDPFASICEARHLQSGYGHVFGQTADDIAMKGDRKNWLVREELKWIWQTNESCTWHAINRDDFCRKIGPNGHIMLVGDSLNHEISWSLMNAIIINGSEYGHLSSSNRSIQGPYEMCEDILGTGQGFKVSYVRNDRLSPVTEATVDVAGNFYEFPWLHLLDQYKIRLLILNRGAHYEDDRIYLDALRKIFTILTLKHSHIRVIYRNTQPGHFDCMNFTQPLSKPQTKFPPGWNWGSFNRQNLLAQELVEEFEYIYMDVYTMLSLRPEGHIFEKDCLHYCLPGPLDIVEEYLYNILLLL